MASFFAKVWFIIRHEVLFVKLKNLLNLNIDLKYAHCQRIFTLVVKVMGLLWIIFNSINKSKIRCELSKDKTLLELSEVKLTDLGFNIIYSLELLGKHHSAVKELAAWRNQELKLDLQALDGDVSLSGDVVDAKILSRHNDFLELSINYQTAFRSPKKLLPL